MVVAAKFKVQLIGGASSFVHCPDPNEANWEYMDEMQVALSGRGVQQGRLRATLTWELMSDGDFGNLMDLWHDSHNDGYRVQTITVPTFAGGANAIYETYGGIGSPGNPDGLVRMMRPMGRRMVLYVQEVSLIFEDIVEDS